MNTEGVRSGSGREDEQCESGSFVCAVTLVLSSSVATVVYTRMCNRREPSMKAIHEVKPWKANEVSNEAIASEMNLTRTKLDHIEL